MKKSKHYQKYPETVSGVAQNFIFILQESNFFEVENVDEDITFIEFADFILPKWIEGNEIENTNSLLTDKDFEFILKMSIFKTNFESLREKKLIDSIEDENGVEIPFLTKMGKEVAEQLQNFK